MTAKVSSACPTNAWSTLPPAHQPGSIPAQRLQRQRNPFRPKQRRLYPPHQPKSPFLSHPRHSLTNNPNPIQVVYLPAQPTKDFQSFSSPLLNVRDSHVSAPFFGPNVWTALVQPVSGGGISPNLPAVQLKVTYKEGGAFDFHTNFERIKERLAQAVENTDDGARGVRGVDLTAVHLDELPAYDAPQHTRNHYSAPREPPPPPPPAESQSAGRRPSEVSPEPSEPPPCYEEVQSQSVAHELEERLRRSG